MDDENYLIRLATVSDIEGINRLYNTLYKSNRSTEKFEWEFNSAPAGKSIYVIAEYKNEIIGTQSVIPYYIITSDNETLLSGKSEDTLVSPFHRGKSIFEKMYDLLKRECRQAGIQFIWGFTYATKPFLKLDFEVPFKVSLGLATLKTTASISYFSSLSSSNTISDKIKIGLLCVASWMKAIRLTSKSPELELDFKRHSLNSSTSNYLFEKASFGLKLDSDFLHYRIESNAYNANYVTVNYRQNGQVLISMVYSITQQNVGFIIHLHIDKTVSQNLLSSFLRQVVKTYLNTCHTLRFWGFRHNQTNARELSMLNASGFTFINRGISFVWLNLQEINRFKPEQFVLSRMASQGTD